MAPTNRTQDVDERIMAIAQIRARSLVGKCGFAEQDLEDLSQHILTEYLRRRPNFDATRASELTFGWGVMRNIAATLIEARSAQRRDYRADEQLSELHVASAGERSSPELAHLRMDMERLLSQLRPELVFLAKVLATEPVTSAVRITGTPRATLYRRKAELRAAFEAAGLRQYLPHAIDQRATRPVPRSAIREKRSLT